ncbi:gamma-glutamyl-gamma-aminobutyrate hydrolase family protein [bacterium]|jgi:gamma-glutamyl-gamma-aminobutyrate hydrolase PuuD|nr:gamma-glutamyl-gamma-aminobutyrate hydrolase family protein [bacterium]
MENSAPNRAIARVVLSMRSTQASGYDEPRDSVSHDWIALLQKLGMTPILLPNSLDNPASYLDALAPDLLILSGGDDPGQDTPRDRSEKIVLDHAVAQRLPVLGVCRGMQVINLYFGGFLDAIAGHVASSHPIRIKGAFEALYGNESVVNSFHALTVPAEGLAPDLVAAAVDDDGNIEALHHNILPIAAVMWHPERAEAPEADRLLFKRLIEGGKF